MLKFLISIYTSHCLLKIVSLKPSILIWKRCSKKRQELLAKKTFPISLIEIFIYWIFKSETFDCLRHNSLSSWSIEKILLGLLKRTNLMRHLKSQLSHSFSFKFIQFHPTIKYFYAKILNDGMIAFISNKWQAIIKFNVTENR